MPKAFLFDVLKKTGAATINDVGFDVFCDDDTRSVILISEGGEDQLEFSDQQVDFCEDIDGGLHAVDDNDVGHQMLCWKYVPVSMEDL